MKNIKVIGLVIFILLTMQVSVFAREKSNADNDIIIPAAGVTLDKDGKPDAWISVPKNLRNQTPAANQNDNNHIYIEPANRVKPLKDMFKKPEGFNIQLQQPSIKVGG